MNSACVASTTLRGDAPERVTSERVQAKANPRSHLSVLQFEV